VEGGEDERHVARAPDGWNLALYRTRDRLNPLWRHLADRCNMNRPIDPLLREGGFEVASLERFRHKGPGVLAHMVRGVATRADSGREET
jgi:hypothetical protein